MKRTKYACKTCGTKYKTKEEAKECPKKDKLIEQSRIKANKLDDSTKTDYGSSTAVLNPQTETATTFISKVYHSGKGFYLYVPIIAVRNADLKDRDRVVITIVKMPRLKVPKGAVRLIDINGEEITSHQIHYLVSKGFEVEPE